jgi:predicted pyridoxine 5'-phosphate oxidase superfamily flavin-nucleotide-binding protein
LKLTKEMKRVVEEQRLCFAATVAPDGGPNLSPKGTVWFWGEDELAFFDLASPQTIANLRRDPRIELNVVDQRLRRGFRFKGRARVTNASRDLLEALGRFPRAPPDASRARSLAVVKVEEARPLVSPVYAVIDDPEIVGREWEAYWLSLWRTES